MGISNIHDALEGEDQRERTEAAVERAFGRVVSQLRGHVLVLERMGEQDMGLLRRDLAGRFHRVTAELRSLLTDLQSGAPPPVEPDGATGMHVMLMGNPVDGLEVYGPFKTRDDASMWSRQNGDYGWPVPLRATSS